MRPFPFSDLAAVMGVSEAHACRLLGINGSVAQDYRRNGVGIRAADRLAVRAGFHPSNVWPSWFEVAENARRERMAVDAERKRRARAVA